LRPLEGEATVSRDLHVLVGIGPAQLGLALPQGNVDQVIDGVGHGAQVGGRPSLAQELLEHRLGRLQLVGVLEQGGVSGVGPVRKPR